MDVLIDPYKLPCPCCRGQGIIQIERPGNKEFDPVDLHVLRAIWQYMAIHLAPPSADDIAAMVPAVLRSARHVWARLAILRETGFVTARNGLRKVPYRAHYLDWNISLPEPESLVLEVPEPEDDKPRRRKPSWLSQIVKNAHDKRDPRTDSSEE